MQSRAQFMDLPSEVRIIIWKYALRPLAYNFPAVHFFSLVNNREDGNGAANISTLCEGASNQHCSGYHLAAPKLNSDDGSHSWTKNNPSAYLWDFGLWGACKESRQVIEAHYEQVDWTGYWRRCYHRAPTYSQTSVSLIAPGNNEKLRFLLHPKRDLVCLQAFDPSTIRWWDNHDTKDICVASNAPASFYAPKIFNFGNIAIAYDPCWNDIGAKIESGNFCQLLTEQSARGFFIRTLAIVDDYARCYGGNRGPNFWLIDNNLQRVHPFKKNRRHKNIFYGNGQNFVEVQKSTRRSLSSGKHSSALDFLDTLAMLLNGDRPSHYIHHKSGAEKCYMCEGSNRYLTYYQIRRQVRVLMRKEST
ncbi:uncharacterized protein Triagg1_3550 [Trichoderma aggressivum f. europaeum]|uniref:2EXR domain-containing protein n=1 Tax=Trichoderma aggressivum f. europaeum TaxID=173218 RepID=A0AAE1IIF5_9HYPO|nr:hypothetical protein Triagg1_3550 [Trichoderma aggressivum f. europaeum]